MRPHSTPLSTAAAMLAMCVLNACHSTKTQTIGAHSGGTHSSSIALSFDGSEAYVVNPDSDSVSVIDMSARVLEHEILLGDAAPALNSATGDFTPAVLPRSVAIAPNGNTVFVSGERSGKLYAIDVPSYVLVKSLDIGSEPAGVVVSPDGASIYVACSQDATVVRVDAASFSIVGTAHVDPKPWALALSDDAKTLLVTHLLRGEITPLDASTMSKSTSWTIPDMAPRDNRLLANGQVRGLYDIAERPFANELWVVHTLLAVETAQPELDFESTAFPGISVMHADGKFARTLSTDAPDVPGIDGAFADVVSGSRALTFTHDGKYAFMLNMSSEDILVVDADTRAQVALLRPLPGHMPEGIVISPDDQFLYVDERNTTDVAVVKIARTETAISLTVDGAAISRVVHDPMPTPMRTGQHLFFSANSDEMPITKNHWVACASCHIEMRSDAVTWRFAEGPRDTPSNAGGMLNTGFLLRTALRKSVQDYWRTINVEQGGHFSPQNMAQSTLLDALADFVNHGIPLPIAPTTDPALVAQGREIFSRANVACATCHNGPRLTDSGANNPSLDLSGTITLHNVGTCNMSMSFPDVAHTDDEAHTRDACAFDTPSLNGVADSGPYFHDGSAATLRDVLEMTRGKMGDISSLTPDEENALIEYLRSL